MINCSFKLKNFMFSMHVLSIQIYNICISKDVSYDLTKLIVTSFNWILLCSDSLVYLGVQYQPWCNLFIKSYLFADIINMTFLDMLRSHSITFNFMQYLAHFRHFFSKNVLREIFIRLALQTIPFRDFHFQLSHIQQLLKQSSSYP